jgi:MFS family permease
MRDLALDFRQVGTLVGLYMLPGLVVALPGGMLAKRFGDKRVVVFGMCMMILGGGVSGAWASYEMVGTGRVLSGIGASVLFVLMTKMITDWFVGRDLFIGMSIFIVGWPIGIAAAQATQGQLAQTWGWNSVFYLTSAMLFAGLLVMVALYRAAPFEAQATAKPSRLSSAEIWLVCLAGMAWMLLNCAYVVFLSFGPEVLSERGTPLVEAGRIVSLMSWVFFFALPLGGYFATHFKAPNIISLVGLTGSVILGLLIASVEASSLTFAAFGIAFAVATPVLAALPSEALRPENRATGFGIYFLWYYAGLAIAPAIAGHLNDRSLTASSSIYFATAMMFGCLCILVLYRLEQRRLNAAC